MSWNNRTVRPIDFIVAIIGLFILFVLVVVAMSCIGLFVYGVMKAFTP